MSLILPGAGIPLAYDGATNKACAQAVYSAASPLAVPLEPFPSWVQPADAGYPLQFSAAAGAGLTDLPPGLGGDPDVTHVSPLVLEFWTALPDAPGAVRLYSGGPGTPGSVPLDFSIVSLWTSASVPTFIDLQLFITRKTFSDPATYYAANWHVCVPIVPLAPTPPPPPPPSVTAVEPPSLADVQFRQTAKRHADAYAHLELGAAVDVTWPVRYMTARRLWTRGVDFEITASSNPVAQDAVNDFLLTPPAAVTPSGNERYIRIGHPWNRKIAPG